MRAAVLPRFDGVDAIEVRDVVAPTAAIGEVAVTVHAASVGPWDVAAAAGEFVARGGRAALPQVMGWDFAGVVAEVGPAAAGLQPGDRVLGFTPQPWSGAGAFAERVVVPAASVARLPDGVTFTDAAVLPVAGLGARQALDLAAVTAGTVLLVVGATGIVGGLTVQLAVLRGATVVAVAAAHRDRLAARLGAAAVVDRDGDVVAQVRSVVADGVAACIDLTGGVGGATAMAAVRDGGRFVTAVAPGPPAAERGISTRMLAVTPDGLALAELARLLAEGALTARVGHVLGLDEVVRAHRYVRDHAVPGKVVLQVA